MMADGSSSPLSKELSAFLDEHFITAASNARCFLSPLSGTPSRPYWSEALAKCCA